MARPTNKQKRAREAKELVENATLWDLLEERAEIARKDWEAASTVEAREACHQRIKAVRELRDYVHGTSKKLAADRD